MRKVKVFFVALFALVFFTNVAMADAIDRSPEKTLRSEIIDLIDHPTPDLLNGKDCTANLRLMVNDNDQLIVLSTGTDDPDLDKYIKSKLNYRKVKASDIVHYQFYFVKMEFKC
jgi:hypothetical protein